VDVETFTVPARDGDVYLLCSDGLSGMVPDGLMESILAKSGPLDATAQALVDAANDNGGRDNITAVLFRVEDDGAGGLEPGSSELGDAETMAGTERAPTTEEIEGARARLRDAPEPDTTAVGSAVPAPERASPPSSQPPAPSPAPSRPRRAATTRGRWLPKALLAAVVVLVLAGGAVYAVSRNVWFLGTDDTGMVALYRGLPYDLPLGVRLYQRKYVSGVPALALDAQRRKRVLDHQLRSRSDAVDLMQALDRAATP
jgi:protein phosphatase